MKVGDKHFRSIWLDRENEHIVNIIDQKVLPFRFEVLALGSVDDVYNAISDMSLRGAPLIGAAAAFGMYFATLELSSLSQARDHLRNAAAYLLSSRPTAVNLEWAINRQLDALLDIDNEDELIAKSCKKALEICDEEAENCRLIGDHGLSVIERLSKKKKGKTINILTHCNAGWLACVDYGTATAPVYRAFDDDIDVHVWVDETRPRNQGSRLTAWELAQHGVPHTVITDNAGGYLMQKGMVDMVIVGSDRTTAYGDVANKTGTYLKALAAKDNKIPFYVALPASTIDMSLKNGLNEIPVEQREEEEVTHIEGLYNNSIIKARICPEDSPASNYGFDITPARLISGLITEKGIVEANKDSIRTIFTDKN